MHRKRGSPPSTTLPLACLRTTDVTMRSAEIPYLPSLTIENGQVGPGGCSPCPWTPAPQGPFRLNRPGSSGRREGGRGWTRVGPLERSPSPQARPGSCSPENEGEIDPTRARTRGGVGSGHAGTHRSSTEIDRYYTWCKYDTLYESYSTV